jgi:hypothetical protein
MRPYLKKTLYKKKGCGVAQGVGPKLKHQYRKKKGRKIILLFKIVLIIKYNSM